MDFFPDALARLKHQLRVSKDQEVAAALGLSKTAFSERKKRGSFPEKELRALAQQRPDIALNLDYILTGKHKPAQEVLSDAEDDDGVLRPERGRPSGLALTRDEEELLMLYRAAPLGVKAAVIGTLLGAENPPAAMSSVMQTIGGSVHGSVAARDIVNPTKPRRKRE